MYLVKLPGEKERGVRLLEHKRGQWKATVDETEDVDLKIKGWQPDGFFDLIINGEFHRLKVERQGETLVLVDGANSIPFDIIHAADLVMRDRPTTTEVSQANETLCSPITGIILEVPVKVGDNVVRGAPLVVIEAMKMENTLGAPISGKVTAVHIADGNTIFVGDELVEISGE